MSDTPTTTTALAKPPLQLIKSVQSLTLSDAARLVVDSGYFKLKCKTPQQAAVKMLRGEELGVGRMAALEGIHVTDGGILIMSAVLMAGIAKRQGYWWKVVKHDKNVCKLQFFDAKDHDLGEVSFTMDDAKTAKITGNQTWTKYPDAMLAARCLSKGMRLFCQDAFLGASVYVPDEVPCKEVASDAEGNIVYTAAVPDANPLDDKVKNLYYQLKSPQQDQWLKLQGIGHIDEFAGGTDKIVSDLEGMLDV